MKKLIIVGLIVCTALLSQRLFADGWRDAPLNKKVPLELTDQTIQQLNIDVGAGDLNIKGQTVNSEILVIAKVYGDEIHEDDYVLSLEKDGDQATLIAHFNGNTYNNERIDLEVSMPSSLALVVEDRSGDIAIESISNGLTLNDRSGDIELNNIAGQVKVEDRSGDLIGKNIRGNMFISDRSGDIQLKEIDGDLKIDDSSGEIRAKDISGVVTVEDSSGSIDINGAKDFRLLSDSSGDVKLRNIAKDLK